MPKYLADSYLKKQQETILKEQYGVEVIKQTMDHGHIISWVTPEVFSYIVELYCVDWHRENGKLKQDRVPVSVPGLFITQHNGEGESGMYEVCDGFSGECYVECFFNRSIALRWLTDQYEDTSILYEQDRKLHPDLYRKHFPEVKL